MKPIVEIGILFSLTASYARLSCASYKGAMSAVNAVNNSEEFGFSFRAIERDPQGNIDKYAELCDEILLTSSARHVFGCTTSWSRKEVIPTLEKRDGTLWYPVPYEGFEASDNVVYAHACPNQHLIPLLNWAMTNLGSNGFFTGSNYIWGWEMNRLAREILSQNGGSVAGERYLPIGNTDIDRIIDEIKDTRPSFVLNNLIGSSQYAFLKAYRALSDQDSYFKDQCLILSCNLTECELVDIKDASEGLISAGPYFYGVDDSGFGNSIEAAAFKSVWELAQLLNGNEQATTLSLSELIKRPNGPKSWIDHKNHHSTLPVYISQVRDGAFQTLSKFDPVFGDPYLARTSTAIDGAVKLRVVK